MNVLFLDYDGVVNTPIWDSEGSSCAYGVPFDNKVNNFQAVQWVSEFCQKFEYKIVVTSTWRMDGNWQECLVNGGLRKDVEIIGKTPMLYGKQRGDEILAWLKDHPDVENFIIADDDCDMGQLMHHLVQCKPGTGFLQEEYLKARKMHESLLARNLK